MPSMYPGCAGIAIIINAAKATTMYGRTRLPPPRAPCRQSRFGRRAKLCPCLVATQSVRINWFGPGSSRFIQALELPVAEKHLRGRTTRHRCDTGCDTRFFSIFSRRAHRPR
jgi:hypothetical protein